MQTEYTLTELIEHTLLESRFKTKAKKVPEFAKHIRKLQDAYKTTISTMAREDNPATADDVYNAIKSIWSMTLNQGISKQELNEFMGVLDGIRDEWANDPDGIHGFGQNKYRTEKENLASYVAQWLTAGLVGSASAYERKPDVGSQRWMKEKDTGHTATGSGARVSAPGAGSSPPSSTHISGQTYKDPGSGESRRFKHYESVDDQMADLIPEDVDDTPYVMAEAFGPAGPEGPERAGADVPLDDNDEHVYDVNDVDEPEDDLLAHHNDFDDEDKKSYARQQLFKAQEWMVEGMKTKQISYFRMAHDAISRALDQIE